MTSVDALQHLSFPGFGKSATLKLRSSKIDSASKDLAAPDLTKTNISEVTTENLKTKG
jgi:hypothetical protein